MHPDITYSETNNKVEIPARVAIRYRESSKGDGKTTPERKQVFYLPTKQKVAIGHWET